MEGNLQTLRISGYACTVYLPKGYNTEETAYPVVYINGSAHIEETVSHLERVLPVNFLIVAVEPADWNNDFSPWTAPPLSKQSGEFGGKADDYLEVLVSQIKPFVDRYYRTKQSFADTTLIGYSLGGLVGLYSLYKTDGFGKIASLSGSLWFDHWIEFMETHPIVSKNAKIYLSLGNREAKSRNQKLSQVANATERAYTILKNQLLSEDAICFEYNDGGHFADVPVRFEKALRWLLKNSK